MVERKSRAGEAEVQSTTGFTTVIGIRGPAAGEYIQVPDADVAAAVAEDGWAVEAVPGTVIELEPNAPLNPAWVVPGYYIPPELTTEPPDPPDPPDPEVPAPLAIASITNSNPAGVNLANIAEISQFTEGDTVTIAGAVGDYAACNGAHVIHSVSAQLGGFLLTGIDTSLAVAPATDPGMTVTPATPASRSAGRRAAPPARNNRRR
jgi:hypothetical protein